MQSRSGALQMGAEVIVKGSLSFDLVERVDHILLRFLNLVQEHYANLARLRHLDDEIVEGRSLISALIPQQCTSPTV